MSIRVLHSLQKIDFHVNGFRIQQGQVTVSTLDSPVFTFNHSNNTWNSISSHGLVIGNTVKFTNTGSANTFFNLPGTVSHGGEVAAFIDGE